MIRVGLNRLREEGVFFARGRGERLNGRNVVINVEQKLSGGNGVFSEKTMAKR